MKISLTKQIRLNPILIDKTFVINSVETIISKLSNENDAPTSSHIRITSFDYEYYSFISIEELKTNLSSKIDVSELEFALFLELDTNVWINFRPDYRSDLNPKSYIVDVSVSSNNTICAEDILESILKLFSNNEFIFFNNDKSDLNSTDNVVINFPDYCSMETTTSKSERDYQGQKEKDAEKHNFKIEILLLLIGTIIGIIANLIYQWLAWY